MLMHTIRRRNDVITWPSFWIKSNMHWNACLAFYLFCARHAKNGKTSMLNQTYFAWTNCYAYHNLSPTLCNTLHYDGTCLECDHH